MITYAVERWKDIQGPELEELLQIHWEEIALNKNAIKLAVDYDRYNQLDEANCFHVVTVRDENRLIGYHAAIISTHLHYKNDLMAFSDVYFLRKEYRKGRTGIKLFQFVEKALKERGVKKVIINTKKHLDMSKLFDYLGWHETETIYTKTFED